MGYCDRSSQHRTQYPVPVKPVLEAIERWLQEEAQRSGWDPRKHNHGIAPPMMVLAKRAGMSHESCSRAYYRFRNETKRMSRDVAARFIEATYGDELWEHPELAPFKPEPEPDGEDWRWPEERVDGEHGIRHWAWQQVKAMSRKERRAVAVGLERLPVDDDSRPARHASLAANRKLAA